MMSTSCQTAWAHVLSKGGSLSLSLVPLGFPDRDPMVVRKKMPPLFSVLSSVLCFEFIFSATHKCNTLCHEAITVQVTIF